MTNNKKRILFTLAITSFIASGVWLLNSPQVLQKSVAKTQGKSQNRSVFRASEHTLVNIQSNTRRPASQIPTPVWKSKLEKSLQLQANGRLKSSEITKVDSFSWKVGKVDVPVESLLIKLVDVSGQTSTFRAMVDSSNGKILQTWDHPQSENIDGKNHDGIRIDSRYHND